MSLNEIIDRFALVSGLGMEEVSRYLTLIGDCKELFEERSPDGLSDAQERRLAHACAVYAYYRVCLLMRDGNFETFKAGDMQVSRGDIGEICEAALRMWEAERESISGIADMDEGFAFRSVVV